MSVLNMDFQSYFFSLMAYGMTEGRAMEKALRKFSGMVDNETLAIFKAAAEARLESFRRF